MVVTITVIIKQTESFHVISNRKKHALLSRVIKIYIALSISFILIVKCTKFVAHENAIFTHKHNQANKLLQ